MNYIKKIYEIIKKIDFIIDVIIQIVENWDSKNPVDNETINKLKDYVKR